MNSVKGQIKDQVYDQVWGQVKDQTSNQVWDQAVIMQSWDGKSINLIWGRVWGELYNQIISDDK
jgi:hypothetical protein